MRRIAVLLAMLVLLAPAHDLRGRGADPIFERVATFVAEQMKEHNVPGVSLGIVHDGTVTTRGFGVTNVDHPLAVTDGTVFQVGSITKTFTGTAIMRLVEQGRVRLDATVRTYLPEFAVRDATASRDATVLDLLTHMGGWEGDVFEDTGEGADAAAAYVAGLTDVEQIAPLRTVWSYNNAGFVVAGRIIEVVTGTPYETALQELVTTPLGLKETYITPADVMTLRFAVGHTVSPKGPQVARPYPIGRYAHAAGGVISTARDLLAYAQFHMGAAAGAASVLSAGTLRRMHAAALTKQGTDEEMAVTWHVITSAGVRRLGHSGATVGQQAALSFVPERKFAIALLTNSGTGSRLNTEVIRRALREYLSVHETDPAPSATQPALEAYAGRYVRPFADLVITVDNGALHVQSIPKRAFPNASAPVPPPGPKVPFAFYATDRAIATGGPQKGSRIDFIRTTGGRLGWVRAGGRILKRIGASS
ncbi:MAG: serine hydrolase domain-containing protein [Vicinamibacterales bacterium]